MYYAYDKGDMKMLVHGFDWNGTLCGKDHNADKPYLYWCVTDTLTVTQGICVSECPKNSSGSDWCPTQTENKPVGQREDEDGNTIYEYSVDVTLSELKHIPTQDFLGMYCLPSESKEAAKAVWDHSPLHSAFSKVAAAAHTVYKRWEFLLTVFICSIVAGFATLALLMYIIRAMVYVLMVLAAVALLIFDAFFIGLFLGHWPQWDFFKAFGAQTAQVSNGVCCVVGLLLTLVFFFFCFRSHRGIENSIETLQDTCDLIKRKKTLLFQPIFDLIVKIFVFVAMAIGLIKIAAMGKVVISTDQSSSSLPVSGLSREIKLTTWQIRWLMYWAIASFWAIEYITAWGQFCIGYTVVVEKVRHKMKCCIVVRGYFFGLFYHAGSLAFGSFILGLLRFITTAAAVLAKTMKTKDKKMEKVTKCLCCCVACCIGCLEKMIEMVNEKAYVDIALNGSNYLTACKNVLAKAAKYPAEFVMVESITKLLRAMVLLVICGGGTFAAYEWEKRQLGIVNAEKHLEVWTTLENASTSVILVLTFVITFNVGLVFGALIDHVSNGVLYCLLELHEAREEPQGKAPKIWMKHNPDLRAFTR